MFKAWNLWLVTITFFLTIFGTFMTRSGAVQSVHAFGEDNLLALNFIVFMAVILIVSIGLIVYRSPKLATKTEFDSFYSREFAFLLNNWILLACAFFVLFATMFPTISEAIDGSRVSVGPEFFNKWMIAGGLALLFLAGAAPLLAWRKTTRERLWNQFTIPFAAMTVTIGVLAIWFPRTRTLSAVFQDSFKLPVSLVNFGLIAFVAASIGQEFWRGVGVRRKQTGSDPFTSLIGLMLSKRRKYGGYIVHLGIAVMFFGFAGKAYDRMIDRTVEKPGLVDARGTGASSFQLGHFAGPFQFGDDPHPTGALSGSDYSFTYERLIHTSDDHMDQITAQVGVFDKGERIATLYPAKRDYHDEQGQMTTEVAIRVRLAEDVYLVLTGFDLDSQQANFRVYINPLILWVWVGFLMLALGTLICLIPQFVVDALQPQPKSRLGRAADLAVVVLLAFGIVGGLASQAYAQSAETGTPNGGAAEHIPAGMGMGNAGGGYAAQNRPDTPTAEHAMKELLCPCGCARQSIYQCDCATAADLRAKVLAILADYDLGTDKGRTAGYNAVLAQFTKEYSGSVLATPKSRFPWLLPSVAAVGALGLLVLVGRRWVTKKPAAAAAATGNAVSDDDDEYTEKLEDELAGTD